MGVLKVSCMTSGSGKSRRMSFFMIYCFYPRNDPLVYLENTFSHFVTRCKSGTGVGIMCDFLMLYIKKHDRNEIVDPFHPVHR